MSCNKNERNNITKKRKFRIIANKNILNAIKIMSYDKNKYDVYGSYNYYPQPFPSDIDGTENIIVCEEECNKYDGSEYAAQILYDLCMRINNTKGYYLGEIKCGSNIDLLKKFINKRYWIYIEEFDPNKVNNDLIEIHEEKLLSDKIFGILTDILKNYKKKQEDELYYNFFEILRNQIVLRWNYEQIKNKTYELNHKKITLTEAVLSSSQYFNEELFKNCPMKDRPSIIIPQLFLIKIDMFVNINNNLKDFSNLLHFMYKENKKLNNMSQGITYTESKEKLKQLSYGRYKDINKDTNKDDNMNEKLTCMLQEALKMDVVDYYYEITKKFTNKKIKYAKRLFVLSLMYNDKKVQCILTKLFHTDANLLNNIVSEINIIIAGFELHNPPIDVLFNQIENLKFRISTLIEFDIDHNLFYQLINKIINDYPSKIKIDDIVEILKSIKDKFSIMINDYTHKFLKENGLWPAPKKYLDDKLLGISIM
jgi:hypothetical protein